MADIPVNFTDKGRTYQGILYSISGAGFNSGKLWYLSVRNYHCGQLFKSGEVWQFYTGKGEAMPELARYFGEVIEGRSPEA